VTPEEALAGGLKLLFALAVLRWPLPGAFLSILADGLDVVVMNYVDLGGGGIRDYHAFDKATDLFGYVTFLLVALRWHGRDRSIAVGLAALRLSGIALFEATGWRGALIACPNLFESWFLFPCATPGHCEARGVPASSPVSRPRSWHKKSWCTACRY